MKEELDAMEELNVWEIVNKEKEIKIIDTRWVFTCKGDEHGEMQAKARLVARGFKDRTEYSLCQTFATVIPVWLIRWMISTANKNDLQL